MRLISLVIVCRCNVRLPLDVLLVTGIWSKSAGLQWYSRLRCGRPPVLLLTVSMFSRRANCGMLLSLVKIRSVLLTSKLMPLNLSVPMLARCISERLRRLSLSVRLPRVRSRFLSITLRCSTTPLLPN